MQWFCFQTTHTALFLNTIEVNVLLRSPRTSCMHNQSITHATFQVVVFRSDEKIGYGIVWELQNDDRSLDTRDRLLLTPIKIFIHQK